MQLTFPIGLFRGKYLQDVYTPAAMRRLQDDFWGNADFFTDSLFSPVSTPILSRGVFDLKVLEGVFTFASA